MTAGRAPSPSSPACSFARVYLTDSLSDPGASCDVSNYGLDRRRAPPTTERENIPPDAIDAATRSGSPLAIGPVPPRSLRPSRRASDRTPHLSATDARPRAIPKSAERRIRRSPLRLSMLEPMTGRPDRRRSRSTITIIPEAGTGCSSSASLPDVLVDVVRLGADVTVVHRLGKIFS